MGKKQVPKSTPNGVSPRGPIKRVDPDVPVDPLYARVAFHLGCAGYMIYGFQSLTDIAAGKFMAPQYGGFFQYLTIIGLFAAIILLVLCAAQDMSPHRRVFVPLRRVILLFALPIEFVISSIYWGIVLTRPDLMFPPNPTSESTPEPSSAGEQTLLFRIPLWMDISMHLTPAVALTAHFFLFESRYRPPASTVGASALAVGFGAVYSTWIEHCAKINGRFPYPFLDVMSADERGAMYIGSTLLALFAFWGLNWVHR